jgi:predicted membrane protein
MRDRLLRVFMVFMGISVTAWVTSLVISTRLTRGDESSDDFRVATIMNGGAFRSHATNLKSGTVITIMGGVRIDLRGATLDPSGASLKLNTVVGGLEVLVPEDWAVEVDQEVSGGESTVNVTPLEELPEDAPRLRIHAVLRLGGAEITAKAA